MKKTYKRFKLYMPKEDKTASLQKRFQCQKNQDKVTKMKTIPKTVNLLRSFKERTQTYNGPNSH